MRVDIKIDGKIQHTSDLNPPMNYWFAHVMRFPRKYVNKKIMYDYRCRKGFVWNKNIIYKIEI